LLKRMVIAGWHGKRAARVSTIGRIRKRPSTGCRVAQAALGLAGNPSGVQEKIPKDASVTPERERLDADVLIVGAGPAGLACALHLSRLMAQHNASGAKPETLP